MRIIKRLCAAAVSAGLLIYTIPAVQAEGPDPDFDAFLDEAFAELLEDDYLTMHYTVRDYQSYGIEKPDLTVGDASWESFAEMADDCNDMLEDLHAFRYDALSAEQKVDYDVLEFYLETTAGVNSYPGVVAYFEPGDGIHDNLLTNFTEFVFYEKKDIDDYLTVLADVPNYMTEAVRVTKRQAEQGYFMTDEALDETLEAMREFTAKKKDNQLIVIFDENVAAFDGLSDAEIRTYQEKNRDIVLNQIIPVYDRCAQELDALRGSRSFEGGLCNYAGGGADYYKALLRYKTSSKDSAEEQLDLCTDVLRELINDYITLVMTSPDAEAQFEQETVSFKTPDEILEYLSSHLDDFPKGADVTYRYSYLDPSVANDSVVAYYMNPPMDAYRDNVIRINGDNISDENDLYETLAHEGFPGHLYQMTWYLATSPAPVRCVLGNLGYTEGWAMYTELIAWDNSGLSEGARELHKIYTALSYVEDAAVDLGVNGLGWDVNDVEAYLDSLGLNAATGQDLYDYVVKFPGLLLPYGVGMARFMTLRKIAEESMGSSFVLKDFNEVLMTNGDRPFELVQADVAAYLERNGKNASGLEADPKPETTFEPYYPELDNSWAGSSNHAVLNRGAPRTAGFFTAGAGLLAAVLLYLNDRRNRKGPLA